MVAFIEEALLAATQENETFNLFDLTKLYTSQLSAPGVHLEKRVHSTSFKNRLLSQFKELSVYNNNKGVILVFNHDVGDAISVAAEANYDDDGYMLARSEHIIRRIYEFNKTLMGNATPYTAYDVSVQRKDLNADTHGHY